MLGDSWPNSILEAYIMQNFYFTYGSEGHPFKGGWTKVRADSRETAIKVFNIFHPTKPDWILCCAEVYSEEEFKRTKMYMNGNLGEYCHEFINLYRYIIREDDNNEE